VQQVAVGQRLFAAAKTSSGTGTCMHVYVYMYVCMYVHSLGGVPAGVDVCMCVYVLCFGWVNPGVFIFMYLCTLKWCCSCRRGCQLV